METRPDAAPGAGSTNKWPKLKLDANQIKPWDETRTAMNYLCPAFADIWYSMCIDRDGQLAWFTDKVPVAGTDDKILYLNPQEFFKLNLDERLFVCAHEIMHAVFNHCGLFYRLNKQGYILYSDGERLPVSGTLLNIAADYVINDILIEAKIGKMPSGEMEGLHDPNLIKGEMNVLDAYRALYKKIKGRGKKPSKQKGDGAGKPGNNSSGAGDQELTEQENKDAKTNSQGKEGKQFDKHLKPGEGRGKSPSKAESERNPSAWDNAVTAAMQSARMRGVLPGNLERLFMATMEPQVEWTEAYGLAVTRVLGNDMYSWEHLDPQLVVPSKWRASIGGPGRIKYGCECIAVFRDSSGSIDDKTCAMFGAETRGALEHYRPRRVILCDCDWSIHRWEDVDDLDILDQKLLGGGGTNFCPPFEKLEELGIEPDLVIYLTDLEGPAPDKEPPYPVIWACITDEKGPWGETVRVPKINSES